MCARFAAAIPSPVSRTLITPHTTPDAPPEQPLEWWEHPSPESWSCTPSVWGPKRFRGPRLLLRRWTGRNSRQSGHSSARQRGAGATSPPRNVAASLRARHWPACPQPSFLRSRVHRQERARCNEGRDDEGLRDDPLDETRDGEG